MGENSRVYCFANMHAFAIALVCLVCAGHTRRVQPSSVALEGNDEVPKANYINRDLPPIDNLKFNTAAAFNPATRSIQQSRAGSSSRAAGSSMISELFIDAVKGQPAVTASSANTELSHPVLYSKAVAAQDSALDAKLSADGTESSKRVVLTAQTTGEVAAGLSESAGEGEQVIIPLPQAPTGGQQATIVEQRQDGNIRIPLPFFSKMPGTRISPGAVGVVALIVAAGAALGISVSGKRLKSTNLLNKFGEDMMQYLGNQEKMTKCIKDCCMDLNETDQCRTQMMIAFLESAAKEMPLSVLSAQRFKQAIPLFELTSIPTAVALEKVAAKLKNDPGTLGKFTFFAERAMPEAAGIAGLRSKFPFDADTVDKLQRILLEDCCRALIADMPAEATLDPVALEILDVTEAYMQRIKRGIAEMEEDKVAAETEKAQVDAFMDEVKQKSEQD